MSGVKLKGAIKKYGSTQVIHGIDLEIESGEFCVFVGPSGCGKSTLLRMIAGLEETSGGQILFDERDVTKTDAADRGIAMVFQTYALYPHMTVEENMSFGLRMNNTPKPEIKKKVDNVSKILQLEEYMKRKPKELSGGQRQRVAIGRALVRGPEVFLFDEPLSNLDAELRVDMRVEIARLHQKIGTTMIYVTHDQVEAMTLADKIVVLRDGLIEQVGSPIDLYSNPDNKFVAGFIGSPSMNFVYGYIEGNQTIAPGLEGQKIPKPNSNAEKVIIGIRPEHIQLDLKGKGLTISIVENLGGVTYVYAMNEDKKRLIIEYKGKEKLQIGENIGIKFDAQNIYYFDSETEMRIR